MKKNPKSAKPSDPMTKAAAAPSAASAPSAPAPKPVAAPAPAPAPVPAVPAAPVAAPKPVAPTPAPVAPVAAKPVAAAPAKKLLSTTISAAIDVGFGHSLYIRGEGAGLSWNRGLLLKNAAADKWSVSFAEIEHPITFKFLIDDAIWSVGENYVAVPGASVSFQPVF